jgi:site-specific recombinase XerD
MLSEIQQFQKWLRRKAPGSSTHIHYTNDLQQFFDWASKPIGEITVRDVDAFIEHCQAQDHAVATINRRLAALRSLYQFLAMMEDHAPANPVRPKRHFIRQGQRLPRDVQDHDLEKLFAVINSPRDRAIFLLMLRCGLRVGEIRHLSLNDLYLYSVPTSLPRLWLHGKGGKERIVYLSSQALQALEEWLQVRPQAPDPAVFLNRFGKRLTVTGIQLQLAGYCERAGVWITCHQFRHTFGRHMVEARVPVTTVQKLLGHAHLRTTEVYLHISDQQAQKDYETAMEQVMERLSLDESSSEAGGEE